MKKAPIARDPCPCGSGAAYTDCCGRFIGGAETPQTAEQLMRSRYSAYSRGDAVWLRATWHPETRPGEVRTNPQVRWIGLRVIDREAGGPGDRQGIVEFIARYQQGGRTFRLHERSRFNREGGRWFYFNGENEPRGHRTGTDEETHRSAEEPQAAKPPD